jgi:transposase-like protein
MPTVEPDLFFSEELATRLLLIQALIPIGLSAVSEVLEREVAALCGQKHSRKDKDTAPRRWGRQRGSVYLSDQKAPILVPRVRDVQTNKEVALTSYQKLQRPGDVDETLLRRLLCGLSARRYADCAALIPETFGLSSSQVSRRFVAASAARLARFQERTLEDLDVVVLFIDGKTFADQDMLIALGITIDGRKIPLGFEQSVTENERVCTQFLRKLVDRGLRFDPGLLVIIDGAKGLYNAVKTVFGDFCLIQRCQFHKRENVLSYLAKSDQAPIRRALQNAYDQDPYEKARADLLAIRTRLERLNPSAARSLEEGLEDTLTLARLGLMPYLKQSFRTTNCIESVNSQVAQRTRNVKRWTTADQRHRWLAAALMDIEPHLRIVKGFRYLPMLRQAVQRELNLVQEVMTA